MTITAACRAARTCIREVVSLGTFHFRTSPTSFWCLAILFFIALPHAGAASEPGSATPRAMGPSVSTAVLGALASGLIASGLGSRVREPQNSSKAWCEQHNVRITSNSDGVLFACKICYPEVSCNYLKGIKAHVRSKHTTRAAVVRPILHADAHNLAPCTDMTSHAHSEALNSPMFQGPLVYCDKEEVAVTWDNDQW